MSATAMYELSGVTKTYKQGSRTVTALSGVDLTIDRGALVAIQGPTGGGKSTLLQILGGLDQPTIGDVVVDGEAVGRMRESARAGLRARKIGFVFQGFNLIPTLTAFENVETALVPLGLSAAQRQERVAEALASVGLADRASHLPYELSGGQQQRVAIARALVKKPTVILADEPTGNLDEETRDDIMALLESLHRDQGITLIIVTHDSAVAARAQVRLTIKDGVVSVA